MEARKTIPRVCATCQMYIRDSDGWECARERACGSVDDMEEYYTTCNSWCKHDDFKKHNAKAHTRCEAAC